MQSCGHCTGPLSTAHQTPSSVTHCKMIATLFSCRQHKEFHVINCNRFVFFCVKFTQQKMFIWFFLHAMRMWFWVLAVKNEPASGSKMNVGTQDNPSAVFCPCSLWFHNPSVKVVTYNIFLTPQVFFFIYRETDPASFSSAGFDACNFIKRERKSLQHGNVWLFLWFTSFNSRLSRLSPLSMPSASSLSPVCKVPLSLLSKPLCCHCALCAKQLQMFLSSTDLFILLHLFLLLHLSSLVSWTAEIKRIL